MRGAQNAYLRGFTFPIYCGYSTLVGFANRGQSDQLDTNMMLVSKSDNHFFRELFDVVGQEDYRGSV